MIGTLIGIAAIVCIVVFWRHAENTWAENDKRFDAVLFELLSKETCDTCGAGMMPQTSSGYPYDARCVQCNEPLPPARYDALHLAAVKAT